MKELSTAVAPFAKNGKILMLALDHRGAFKSLLNRDHPDTVMPQEIITLKERILRASAKEVSGVLIDPLYGLPAYRSAGLLTPYLLSTEKTGYESVGNDRRTIIESHANVLKEQGAHGVKLLLYYQPFAETAVYQRSVAKQVANECRDNNLPFFLEIVTYGDGPVDAMLIHSINDFLEDGIRPDVFKLEFPGSKESCLKITEILKDIPWILLTRGVTYPIFEGQLSTAISAVAVGYLAGRAVWQEGLSMKEGEDRENFIQTTIPERLKRLADIALSGN